MKEKGREMRKESVVYWNTVAASGDREARDAVLSGFTTEQTFDEAGREDARHLIYPFITPDDVVLDVGCGLGRLLKWAAQGCAAGPSVWMSPRRCFVRPDSV